MQLTNEVAERSGNRTVVRTPKVVAALQQVSRASPVYLIRRKGERERMASSKFESSLYQARNVIQREIKD